MCITEELEDLRRRVTGKYRVGSIHKTYPYGNLEVIERLDNRKVKVRFINTGSEVVTDTSRIAGNLVKDPKHISDQEIDRINKALGISTVSPRAFTNDWNHNIEYNHKIHTHIHIPTRALKGKSDYFIDIECGAVIHHGGMCRVWGEPKNLVRLADSLGLDDELSIWIAARLESVAFPNKRADVKEVIQYFLD